MKPNARSFYWPLILGLFLLVGASTLSAQSTGPKLSDENQVYSDLFKSQTQVDRTSTFSRLQGLILPTELGPREPLPTSMIGANTTTEEEIIYLLGEPDMRIQQSLLRYYLRGPGAHCRLDIGLNEHGQVSFFVIKDCQ
ncbi:MAG: hypothetical protein LCH37_15560 [Bacteroidetes bacterium]|nr:hypothetical protein [Bacteroidota bacterium]